MAKKKTTQDYDHTIALMASEQFAHGECSVSQAVQLARDLVAEVIRTENGPSPEPPPDLITANLQAAIDAAAAGAALHVDPALVEPGAITITKPLTLQGAENVVSIPALVEAPMPSIRGGLTISGPHVTVVGFDIQKTQDYYDIVSLTGEGDIHLADCRILGDKVRGNKRGVMANAPDITLTNCLVDYCFAPGQDSQAVCGWDNCINLTLTGCVLVAASENVLIGGSDPASEDRQPRNFRMSVCKLTKRPEWRDAGFSVKNIFELKNCLGATVVSNEFEQCWADGQDGYAIVLTPRNQGNTAPSTNVTDVIFQHNTIRHVATGFNLLGTDYPNKSGVMDRIQILDNLIDDLDCVTYGKPSGPGSNKAILMGDGCQHVTISNNKFTNCQNVGYSLYFYGKPNDYIDCIDNAFPTGKYGTVGGDSTAAGEASWDAFVLHGTYSGNTP